MFQLWCVLIRWYRIVSSIGACYVWRRGFLRGVNRKMMVECKLNRIVHLGIRTLYELLLPPLHGQY